MEWLCLGGKSHRRERHPAASTRCFGRDTRDTRLQVHGQAALLTGARERSGGAEGGGVGMHLEAARVKQSGKIEEQRNNGRCSNKRFNTNAAGISSIFSKHNSDEKGMWQSVMTQVKRGARPSTAHVAAPRAGGTSEKSDFQYNHHHFPLSLVTGLGGGLGSPVPRNDAESSPRYLVRCRCRRRWMLLLMMAMKREGNSMHSL